MLIQPLASSISDNFMYVVSHAEYTAVVDPFDAQTVQAFLGERPLHAILNTHWHPDHVGGNKALRLAFPDVLIYGPADEATNIEDVSGVALDVHLTHEDTVALGDIELEVLSIPGHTHGHIGYLHGDHLLSGDAIFAAGAGNVRFGGDAGTLFQTFRDVLRALPPTTKLYPGHDYGRRNLEFALSILPDFAPALDALSTFSQQPPRSIYITTLAMELAYNPFLRYDDPALVQALETTFPEDVAAARDVASGPEEAIFRALRSMRDRW